MTQGIGFVFRGRVNLYSRPPQTIKPDALHLWLCIQSPKIWNGFCAVFGKEVGMIVVRSRSNVMFALVTGFPLESRYIIWMFLSIMGCVSRRPTAFIKLLDIQMKSHFTNKCPLLTLTGSSGTPEKSCFGLVLHSKSAVRGAEIPKYCFWGCIIQASYLNFWLKI